MVAAAVHTRMAITSRGRMAHFLGNLEARLVAPGIRLSSLCLLLVSQMSRASTG